ncbi:hypothetical protein BJ964_003469 [Actinoplanes lobatus]|uniref:Uncharacterized protein n=1 Tax=Actinoplanes lobatus TaxID=113568 RepID=A0A7W7HEY4_9ACTN|nr:hypothetical protein [Actinoplanes lobatus]
MAQFAAWSALLVVYLNPGPLTCPGWPRWAGSWWRWRP